MELWDVYDENRNLLGKKHIRGNRLAKGEYHLTTAIWILNSKKQILLTKRDPKKSYPNRWENTCGSAIIGEDSKQSILRELKEETGIVASESEVILINSRQNLDAIIDLYFLKRDIEVKDLTMQIGETVDAKWCAFDEVNELVNTEDATPCMDIAFGILKKYLLKSNHK